MQNLHAKLIRVAEGFACSDGAQPRLEGFQLRHIAHDLCAYPRSLFRRRLRDAVRLVQLRIPECVPVQEEGDDLDLPLKVSPLALQPGDALVPNLRLIGWGPAVAAGDDHHHHVGVVYLLQAHRERRITLSREVAAIDGLPLHAQDRIPRGFAIPHQILQGGGDEHLGRTRCSQRQSPERRRSRRIETLSRRWRRGIWPRGSHRLRGDVLRRGIRCVTGHRSPPHRWLWERGKPGNQENDVCGVPSWFPGFPR